MKIKIPFIAIMLFVNISPTLSQDSPVKIKAEKEIIAYIVSGIEKNGEGKVTEITNEKIQRLLNEFQIQINDIELAFPDFKESDTLVTSTEGLIFNTLNLSKVYKITIGDNMNRSDVIEKLSKLPEVIYAEPNAVGRVRIIPNDQYFGNQWALRNTGQNNGTTGADIKTTDAWNIFTGSSNTIVGIVDVGRVQQNHPDLDGKVTGNLNTSISNHSTHVAGIAAAKSNNTTGIAGVNWFAKINTQTIGDIPQQAAAIIAAVNAGAKIINNSWGQGSNVYSPTVANAFAYSYKSNVVSCNANPETGSSEDYPNAYGSGIINVGATNNLDIIAWYSFGRSYTDVSAPGGDENAPIYSTISGGYGNMYGTSMAAPHVAGIASLLKGYNSSLYNDDIEQIIKLSADDKGNTGWDQYYGTGRVNAYKALRLISCPNTLVRLGPYIGGTVISTSSSFNANLSGIPGLLGGFYQVIRYEVIRDI